MRTFLFLLVGVMTNTLMAASAPSCGDLKTTLQFYQCLLAGHPDYQAALLNYDIAKATRDRITQWPNPELSVKSVQGDNAGESMGGTEIGLSIDLTDVLVKRAALSKAGRSEEKLLRIVAEEEEFRIQSQVVKDLVRYRQMAEELELVEEALGAFGKIEGQFRSRRARGPEQEITLNLVELVQGDYQLKRNHLLVEKSEFDTKFKGIFGEGFQINKTLLPALKKSWPKISESEISKETFELRRAFAERDRADAEKSIANWDSWLKVAAGPVFERTTEGPNQYTSTGFNLSVSLPLFSVNGGARDVASKNAVKAELAHGFAVKTAILQRQLILQKYNASVESLAKSSGGESLAKKHARIDAYFRQGLSSGATMIEAHRQILEFTESQHEHEITAMDSLMYIYLLSGKPVSGVLQ